MIEDERYCVDILLTVSAAIGALKKVETIILRDHLNSCAKKAFYGASDRDKREKLDEIISLLESFRK